MNSAQNLYHTARRVIHLKTDTRTRMLWFHKEVKTTMSQPMAIQTERLITESERSSYENCQFMILRPQNSHSGNKQPMILISNFARQIKREKAQENGTAQISHEETLKIECRIQN